LGESSALGSASGALGSECSALVGGAYDALADGIEIYVNEDTVVLKKYEPACIFCGNAKDIVNFKSKNICPACVKEIGSK